MNHLPTRSSNWDPEIFTPRKFYADCRDFELTPRLELIILNLSAYLYDIWSWIETSGTSDPTLSYEQWQAFAGLFPYLRSVAGVAQTGGNRTKIRGDSSIFMGGYRRFRTLDGRHSNPQMRIHWKHEFWLIFERNALRSLPSLYYWEPLLREHCFNNLQRYAVNGYKWWLLADL